MIIISHVKLQMNISMLVSWWKWMVPSLPFLSCESSVSLKENPDRKKKLHLKQKHAVLLTCNENKFTHTKPLMRALQVLNVFQINIQKPLCLCIVSRLVVMYQVFLQINSPIFHIYTQQIYRKATFHYLNI